jgi:hypothetical protein
MLVVEENILALSSVLTPVEHTLEHPQEATEGGGGGAMPEHVERGTAEVDGTP